MKQKPKLLDTGLPKIYLIAVEFANQRARIILPSRELAQAQADEIRSRGIYLGHWVTDIQVEERNAVGNEFA